MKAFRVSLLVKGHEELSADDEDDLFRELYSTLREYGLHPAGGEEIYEVGV